ncbi:hypothetical protein [Candidatus Chlamydia corallus]|uniref:hypothetical protein n=1 Tax=Candidatus Chlamydia corallus TaxID=2038470 RepID=UPI000C2FBA03|nr:hypothetical protein [Candidatus Chlamydia corallus]
METISTPSSRRPPTLSHNASPIPFSDPFSAPTTSPPLPERIPSQDKKKETKSSVITTIAFAILGLIFFASGILTACLGGSLTIFIPLFILSAIFIVLTLLYFVKHLKEPVIREPPLVPHSPKITPPITPEPSPKFSPKPSPKPLTPEVEALTPPTPPKTEDRKKLTWNPNIQYPAKYDYSALHNLLKQLFYLDPTTNPGDRRYPDKLTCVRMRAKEKPAVSFHCFKGHFSSDEILNKESGAIVIVTHSSMDSSMTVGRATAVSACLRKTCWEAIKNSIPSSEKKLAIGSCISGSWTIEKGDSRYASHLIFINPPTLETLIREKIRRAIALTDFSMKEAFSNLVMAYLQCFDICIENNLTSIQLEVLGLNNLSRDQEEYSTWEYCCHLALMEALRILLASENSLVNISVNSPTELPMKTGCQALFRSKKS